MAVKYTRPSFPTTYKGQRYRSRLEARWAAFFDLAGWQAEYEPVDLGEWSPDFLLRNRRDGTALYDRDILVEVKPIAKMDDDVRMKMETAYRADMDHGLLLVGFAPHEADSGIGRTGLAIGWIRESQLDLDETSAAWVTADAWVTGISYGLSDSVPDIGLWRRATNLVQWKPQKRYK